MSYCRNSQTSDVYVYKNLENQIICCSCSLCNKSDFKTKNPEEIYQHLMHHKQSGDKVPGHAFDLLEKEFYINKNNFHDITCNCNICLETKINNIFLILITKIYTFDNYGKQERSSRRFFRSLRFATAGD